MSEEQAPQVRVRVNTGYTASGKYTWDGTVEITAPIEPNDVLGLQAWREEAVNQSDELVKALRARYGPQEVTTNDNDLLPALEASVEQAKRKGGAK